MNDRDRNLRIAQSVKRDLAWNGQVFHKGDFVALLDGQVIAVEKTVNRAITALRSRNPGPKHGLVVEVSPSRVEVIRRAC